MNKKGFTLVELIISIVLISIIIIPTFAIVLDFKNRQQIAADKQELIKFKNLITNDIESDILTKGLKELKYESSESSPTITLIFSDDTPSKELSISIADKTIKYGSNSYNLNVEYADIATETDMRTYYGRDSYIDATVRNNDDFIYYYQIRIPITYVNDNDDIESVDYGINIIAEKAP